MIEVIHQNFDLVVVGGGISGTCAAISAARNGSKVALVHERSALGGNSSSEVRLYPEDTCTFSTWIKEAGILEEMSTEERARNWEPYIEGLMNSQWDLVLYEWAKREKNLTLFLNTTMREVEMADEAHILTIHGAQLGTEREFILEAPLFVDSSGDGVLAYRAGADFRWGREGQSEYHESLAPPEATDKLMGNTLFFRARDTGRPIAFKRPDWAAEFDTERDLTDRNHGFIEGGYWWIEVGSPLHPIRDNEAIRDETLRQLLGVWDHIKNHCTDDHVRERAANFALEFIGFWPYKRESRRVKGDIILIEKDVRDPAPRTDDIAYGTWGIDIHIPGGILERHVPPYPSPRSDANFPTLGTIPYGIPLRSCYSRNIRNLFTAGRPISASYIAFASSRVLPTGALVGQGVGIAAALCKKHQCDPTTVAARHANELQQMLLRQDASMPGVQNTDPNDLARKASVTASSDARLEFPESDIFHPANLPLGQLFPVSTDHLEKIELLLESNSDTERKVQLSLRKVRQVWDMRPSREIASATVTVPPNSKGYVVFPLNVKTEPGSLYFVHMEADPKIAWAHFQDKDGEASKIPVGTTAADLPGGTNWRPMTTGQSFSLRVLPEQRPYTAQNIVRGTNRPDLWTNIFVSDAAQALPAWVELQFPNSIQFNQIQVTFDTDTNRRIRLPLFRYPECVKRYEIAVPQGSGWRTIAGEDDNYARRRVHAVEATTSDRLRINILETNGAPNVRIYEVRIYNEPAPTSLVRKV
ncbi:MAG: FAD-dependent oxidoreductase [Acidobacteriaceae bacterium]